MALRSWHPSRATVSAAAAIALAVAATLPGAPAAVAAPVELATGEVTSEVTSVASTTTVQIGDVYEGQRPIARVQVTSEAPVTGSVGIIIEGVLLVGSATLTDGQGMVLLPPVHGGPEVNYTAYYYGAPGIVGSYAETTIQVMTAQATTTQATVARSTYGTPGTVDVTVKGAAVPLGDVTVTSGSFSRDASLSLPGVTATVTLPKTWKPGTRTLQVDYTGSLSSLPSQTTVTATVTKAAPKVTAVRETAVAKGSRSTLVATVASDVARETGQVQAYVGDKPVSAKVTLVRSGSVYKVRFRTWKLPEGRIAIKYSGNALLQHKRAATGLYAR
ncbi:hypothetical protein [Demequina silvatica]|uniref:hypothetical protein n=1 Tax=Demequina silvatica TaxID=1638988 RepID=UPI0007867B55|nr:hypothetical protein [Demequina silvatica]